MSEYHVDAALSNFAVSEHFNGEEAFIASTVCPQIPVKKKSDVFYKFSSDYINTDVTDERDGKSGFANEVNWTYGTDNYSCKERALRKFSSRNEIENADNVVVVDQRDALHIKQRLLLRHEMRVAALAAASTNKLTPTVKWDASGTTTIMADLVEAKRLFKEQIGVEPNLIVLDSLVADRISIQAEIQNIVKYLMMGDGKDKGAIAIAGSQGALPSTLQGMKPLIASAFYNAANPAQTRSVQRVWGKDVFLLYVDPTPSVESPTWAKNFVFENLTMTQYTFPGKPGRYVEGYWTLDEKVTLAGACLRIVAAIS